MPEVREQVETEMRAVKLRPFTIDDVYRLRDRRQRNQRIRAGVLALVIVLAVAIAGARALRTERVPADVPTPSPLQAHREAGDDAIVNIDAGKPRALPTTITSLTESSEAPSYYQVSPDGTMLAFAATGIYVANVGGSNVRQLTQYGGTGPQWSPDSTKIVYSDVGDIVVVEVATGETTKIAHVSTGAAPTFGPNGDTILFTERANRLELRTIPLTGGTSTLLVRNAAFGSYSPDGTKVAYWSVGGFFGGSWYIRGIEVLDLAKGVRQEPAGNPGSGCMGFACNDTRPVPDWSPDGRRIAFSGTWEPSSTDEPTYVMDASSGAVVTVGLGGNPTWLDNDTLVIEEYRGRVQD